MIDQIYKRSRILASFVVFGETFHIVRKRFHGRGDKWVYWGMYPKALACVYDGRDISGDHWPDVAEATPADAAIFFENKIHKIALHRDDLLTRLRNIGARA